ncbi:hypothetical protein C3489_13450 [Streptomyces sp. Ru71]|uniref:DUF6479 family protein n=1 Tax=Streptomyces sp. Ru71 TaxID=2080746 RepID=UPI000CDD1C65|nr:DUF6479 family protein [Streptomyces sp. Ru71]POX54471.1 hypothetical protein C3489_13450 [Streptomyces sp. Ru71]
MDTSSNLAAATGSVVGVVAVLAAGVIITGALVWAIRLGIKVRRREHRAPRPEEQPTLPPSGPVREVSERRAPDETPRAWKDGERLTPHELHSGGGRLGRDQRRPRWEDGSGGSFGSGGPGGS